MNPLADPNTLVPLACTTITLGYLGTCAIWPFKACRRCHGTGRLASPLFRKALRLCPYCDASGLKLRAGRRAYNQLQRLRRANRRDRNR